jgi:hypothetical protein
MIGLFCNGLLPDHQTPLVLQNQEVIVKSHVFFGKRVFLPFGVIENAVESVL